MLGDIRDLHLKFSLLKLSYVCCCFQTTRHWCETEANGCVILVQFFKHCFFYTIVCQIPLLLNGIIWTVNVIALSIQYQ